MAVHIPKMKLVLFVILFIAACDAAFFNFALISSLVGADINRTTISAFGKTISAQALYMLLLCVAAFVFFFIKRRTGTGKESLLVSILYGITSILLLAYVVALYVISD